jgi:hypothetical protein
VAARLLSGQHAAVAARLLGGQLHAARLLGCWAANFTLPGC